VGHALGLIEDCCWHIEMFIRCGKVHGRFERSM